MGNIPAWFSFERKNQFPCVKSSGALFFTTLSPKCGHHHEHLIAWPETSFNCCVSSEFGPIQIPEKFHFLFGSCNNDSRVVDRDLMMTFVLLPLLLPLRISPWLLCIVNKTVHTSYYRPPPCLLILLLLSYISSP